METRAGRHANLDSGSHEDMDIPTATALVAGSISALTVVVGLTRLQTWASELLKKRAERKLRKEAAQCVAQADHEWTPAERGDAFVLAKLRGESVSKLKATLDPVSWGTFVRFLYEEAKVLGFTVFRLGDGFVLMRI